MASTVQSQISYWQRKTPMMVNKDRAAVVDAPAHYLIPHESGYFPAGSDEAGALVAKVENATLYQIYPRHHDNKSEEPLATGMLTLRDPDAGTADDVVLVGQCGDTIFYVMNTDATTKTSDSEFVIMLPRDCIVVDLTGCSAPDVLQVESLFAARTKFHDETIIDSSQKGKEGVTSDETSGELLKSSKRNYPENLPDDIVSRSMFRASSKASQIIVRAGEMGASKIDAYGEKKKEEVTKSKDVKVGKTSITLAKKTRTVSEKVCTLTEKVSGKISDALGGKVGRAAATKDGDSARRRKMRSLLLASTISYAEVGSGAAEGYELMVKSAQSQATSFVAKKYGASAAELCRHTTGAAVNFGRAALTAQRVVNVKKLVKSAGKQMVKESIKSAIL